LLRPYFLLIPPPPLSTLFPYTTLFRSVLISSTKSASPSAESAIQEGCSSFHRSHANSVPPLPHRSVANVRRSLMARREFLLCKEDRKSTRLNSSHVKISYAVFCLKKKK